MSPLEVQSTFFSGQHLEQIRSAPEHVVGSDKNSDLIMNFQREHNALLSFWKNYQQETGETTPDSQFERLVEKWLYDQHLFYLSEHGCGRYLQIQPTYEWQLSYQENELVMSPVGLQQFGNLTTRWQQVNSIVGNGLAKAYTTMKNSGSDTWVGVMSGTEMYKEWNSDTDVINLMRVKDAKNGICYCEGKYLVLNHILKPEERRFIHNLFYLLGQGFPIDSVAALSGAELKNLIETKELWGDQLDFKKPDFENMARYPQSFHQKRTNTDDELYSFAQKLNYLFKKRFNNSLIQDSDISMYPVIRQIANNYKNQLNDVLWYQPAKEKYYNTLRRIVYECQEIWGQNQGMGDWQVVNYLTALAEGEVVAGFEVSFDEAQSEFINTAFFSPWQNPYGFIETSQKCKHGFPNEKNCPKCKHSSN